MTKKKTITSGIIVLIFVIIFAAVFGWKAFVNKKVAEYMKNYKPAPAAVTTTKVTPTSWTPYISSTGSLQALNGVDVSPQTNGIITKIMFKSGQMVNKGQDLILLDNREAKAQVDNAMAAMKLADISYQRQAKLFKTNSTPKADLDSAKATLDEATAKLEQLQTALSYYTVKSPFAGKIGIKDINLGQFISAGTTIANLQTIDPIYVNYYVPEQDISKIYIDQPVTLTISTFPKVEFTGKISAIDSQVGADTKSIKVQALVPNNKPKSLLIPGMFATVHTLLPKINNIIAVPQEGVTYTLYGDSVYVVANKQGSNGKPENYAKQVYVTLGAQNGNLVQIKKGLKAGDSVITNGQVKLQNGSSIAIENNSKPSKNN